MGFTKTVADFCGKLDQRPKVPAVVKTSIKLERLPAVAKEALEKVEIPSHPTSAEMRKHSEASLKFQGDIAKAFLALPEEERKKLNALAHAGKTGGKVKGQFKFFDKVPVSTLATTVDSATIQKGLAMAKKEGVNLEAKWT